MVHGVGFQGLGLEGWEFFSFCLFLSCVLNIECILVHTQELIKTAMV